MVRFVKIATVSFLCSWVSLFSASALANGISGSGTISSINDPLNHLANDLGLTTIAPGQTFSASYSYSSLSPATDGGNPNPTDTELTTYVVTDAGSSMSLDISGAGGSPFNISDGLNLVTLSNDYAGVNPSFMGSDLYGVTDILFTGVGYELYYSVVLQDTSQTNLTDESFYVETSSSSWNLVYVQIFKIEAGVVDILAEGTFSSFGVGLTLQGTVSSITDPNNYLLNDLGFTSLSVGQPFATGYGYSSLAPSTTGPFTNPVDAAFTTYLVNDSGFTLSLDITGSGGPTISANDADSSVDVANDYTGSNPAYVGSDVYIVTDRLFVGTGYELYLSILLQDSSQSRLSNDSFFVEDSDAGWDAASIAIYRVAPGVLEILATGTVNSPGNPNPVNQVSGTILSISDDNNILPSLGFTSLSVGQVFTASYDLPNPMELSNQPALGGGTAYSVEDAAATATLEVTGSGAGAISTMGFDSIGLDVDAGIVVRNDLDGVLSPLADRYQVSRLLPNSIGEVLFLNIFLADSSATKLSDESYIVETSKAGYNLEGFTITRLVPPSYTAIETILVGGNTSISSLPLTVNGTVQALDDPNNILDTLGMTSVALGQTFDSTYNLTVPPGTPTGPSVFRDGDIYGLTDASASVSLDVSGSGTGLITGSPYASIFNGSDVTVSIGNNLPTSVSSSTDYYVVGQDLVVAGRSVFIGTVLADTTGTRLNNQDFYIEDSVVGWDVRGFIITDVNDGLRTLLSGSNLTDGTQLTVNAGGTKGPLINANLALDTYTIVNGEIQLGQRVSSGVVSSGAEASNLLTVPPFGPAPPYILTVTSGTDITTGSAPVITELQTIVTREMLDNKEQVWASVLTSIATKMAAERAVDESDLENQMPLASAQVLDVIGFGAESFDIFTQPPVLTPDTDTQVEQANVFSHRLANEVVGQLLANTGNADQELENLAGDIASDGDVDDVALQTAIIDVGANGAENFMVPDPNNPGSMTSLDAAIEAALVSEVSTLQEPGSVDSSFVETQDLFATSFDPPMSAADLEADSDGDGTPDSADDFPLDPGATTAGGANDDDDGDGTINNEDDAPQDPSIQTDADMDGIDDSVDLDINSNLNIADSDGDGTVDAADAFPADSAESADSDGDGVGDNADAFPNDPLATTDTDSDGVADGADNCLSDSNSDQLDTDGDSQGNVCDADDDNDGFTDAEEMAAGSDPLNAAETPETILIVPMPLAGFVFLAMSLVFISSSKHKDRH